MSPTTPPQKKKSIRELCFIPSTPRNPSWPRAAALVILYVEFENTKHSPYPTYPVIREPLLQRVREGQDMHIQIIIISLTKCKYTLCSLQTFWDKHNQTARRFYFPKAPFACKIWLSPSSIC